MCKHGVTASGVPEPLPTATDRALSVSDGLTESAADIPTPEKTIENPIPDISKPNQSPALCKTNPEIDSCPVCRHPEHETLREILYPTP